MDYKKAYRKILALQVPEEEIDFILKNTMFKEGPAPEGMWLEETCHSGEWSFDIVVLVKTYVYYYKDS